MRVGRKGFTIIEMIVVMTIIAIMAAVAVPAVMHYVKDADTESASTIFDDVTKNVNVAIMQANSTGREIKMDNILNDTYAAYQGSYAPGNIVKGTCPYTILPHSARTGECITVELVRIMDGVTYMGSGYIVRFYSSSNFGDPTNDTLKTREDGTELKVMRTVPGVVFEEARHGATIVNPAGEKVTPPTPPAS